MIDFGNPTAPVELDPPIEPVLIDEPGATPPPRMFPPELLHERDSMIPHLHRSLFGLIASVGFALAGLSHLPAAEVDPFDWPHWRGPEMNGISRETGLVSSWSTDGENLLWRKPEYGTRSTPICMRGKLYFICRHLPETTKEAEKVVCLNAETGELIWENIYNVYLTDAPAERVGWASVLGDPATGNIYALGLCGVAQCIDGETGKTVWSHSMSEEYGLLSTYGGRTNFPTLFDDLIIFSGVQTGWGELAIPAHRFIAFNKETGEAVWLSSTRLRPEDTTYSTPVLGVFNGQAAMVVGSGDGSIYALQPRTGQVIWSYDASLRGINTTPLIIGDRVYGGHSEENVSDNAKMGAVFCLDATKTGNITKNGEIWSRLEIGLGRAQPIVYGSRLYAATDSGTLSIIDIENGKEVGKQKLGTMMFGSPLFADGRIYAGEAAGRWYVMEPQGNKLKVVHRLRLEGEEIIASPIVSHGRIYLPTMGALYCIGKKDHQPAGDPIPEPRKETPVSADTKPAHIQVVPVEALLKPGDQQSYSIRVYNKSGQLLKSAPATFTLQGPGKISGKGDFTAPSGSNHSVTMVTAELDGLKSTARVRTIPPFPWSFDFGDKKVPSTWIGTAYRHQIREVEGNPMLVKVNTIPKGTRSQGWIGHPSSHDYTIQADFRATRKNDQLPDMGLINQRYTLDLMGAAQQLQIRSWTPRLELRFAKSVPHAWKEDVWYTLKFQSENQPGQAVLRGKVWPRDEAEPKDWMIEAADLAPNTIGSPGLFGNASVSEFLIDNLKVYDNPK